MSLKESIQFHLLPDTGSCMGGFDVRPQTLETHSSHAERPSEPTIMNTTHVRNKTKFTSK